MSTPSVWGHKAPGHPHTPAPGDPRGVPPLQSPADSPALGLCACPWAMALWLGWPGAVAHPPSACPQPSLPKEGGRGRHGLLLALIYPLASPPLGTGTLATPAVLLPGHRLPGSTCLGRGGASCLPRPPPTTVSSSCPGLCSRPSMLGLGTVVPAATFLSLHERTQCPPSPVPSLVQRCLVGPPLLACASTCCWLLPPPMLPPGPPCPGPAPSTWVLSALLPLPCPRPLVPWPA